MVLLLGVAELAQADFVLIGYAGNAADTTGYGAVSYDYKISATEVTIAEFQASGAGDGGEDRWNTGTRSVGSGAPAVSISLYEARKYCNWLTTGDVNSGYYGVGGSNMSGLSHDAYAAANGRTYFVPTEDEWYKAAYYTGSGYSLYADGTSNTPIEGGGAAGWNYNRVNSSPNFTRDTALGSVEQNGTYNMMGNVWEWMEDSGGIIRGGSYDYPKHHLSSARRSSVLPSHENNILGFRPVEVVPEPVSMGLVVLVGGFGWLLRRRFLTQ